MNSIVVKTVARTVASLSGLMSNHRKGEARVAQRAPLHGEAESIVMPAVLPDRRHVGFREGVVPDHGVVGDRQSNREAHSSAVPHLRRGLVSAFFTMRWRLRNRRRSISSRVWLVSAIDSPDTGH